MKKCKTAKGNGKTIKSANYKERNKVFSGGKGSMKTKTPKKK